MALSTQSKYPTVALALLITGSISQYASAGAWVPAKGEGYNKVGYASYSSDDFFGNTTTQGAEFDGLNTSFYGEVGLGNNFAIYGSLLHQNIEQSTLQANPNVPNTLERVTTENSGFGDTELGVRYQWQANPFVLSTSFLVKLPFLYDENDALPRGNGQEDYEFKVLLGKGLNQFGYFGVEAGYRIRVDAPSDEYRYLIEYGFNATKHLYFRSKLDGIASVGNSDVAASTVNVDGSTNLSQTAEFDLGKLELTAGWNFGAGHPRSEGQWGVEVTYTKDLFGDNTLKGNSVQVGLTLAY